MKLLMITRRVDKDDPQAGFAFNWVKKIASKVDELKVICLYKGNTEDIGSNIKIFSLGKERNYSKLKQLLNFCKLAFKIIPQIDAVFCHQNPEYTILTGPFAKIFNKKIVSWYAHKHVDWRVKLMNFFADIVITPSKQGFNLKSKKRKIIGHGIDTDLFKPASATQCKDSSVFKIISVGRISPIKDYETLIETSEILKNKKNDFEINIFGEVPFGRSRNHLNKLEKLIKEKDLGRYVFLRGGISQNELVKSYQDSDLAVNLCPTGAPDKAVLEAMACGIPVLACNQTFIREFGKYKKHLLFKEKDADDLAEKILFLSKQKKFQLKKIGSYLREKVVKRHNLDILADKIIKILKEI